MPKKQRGERVLYDILNHRSWGLMLSCCLNHGDQTKWKLDEFLQNVNRT